MNNEVVLLESRTLRGSLVQRTEALEKVKALVLLPDGVHMTARMVADYFGVGDRAINTLVNRHREELQESGYQVLKGPDLRTFVSFNLKLTKSPGVGLGVFPRRAVLNVAMLLRDSPVAREVRRHLLDLADRERGSQHWQDTMLTQLVDRAELVVRTEVAALLATQQELRERIEALEATNHTLEAAVQALRESVAAAARESFLERELLAAMSARLAETSGEVRTMGGRLDLLCTLSATPGRGRRRR